MSLHTNAIVVHALIPVLFALGCARTAQAANPFVINSSGQPLRWDNSKPIVLNPDLGNLGAYGNTAAISQILQPALAVWSSSPMAYIRWNMSTPLPRDIETLDDLTWALNNNYSPIVFDSRGRIIAALGLPTQSVVAMAAPYAYGSTTIARGLAIINGLMIDGDPANGEISPDQMIMAVAHELGHFLNLDHSQVNGHMFLGDTDDPSYRKFGPPPADSVEIMYPFVTEGSSRRTLTRDDEAGISMLYPSNTASGYGFIFGRIFQSGRSTAFQGANVVARNVRNPYYDAVSAVSGVRYQGVNGGSTDIQLKGLYQIFGLTPYSSYAVEVTNLMQVSSFGSSTGPLFPHAVLPGPEEFYSGPGENIAGTPDHPLDLYEVRVDAGHPTKDVDILINDNQPLIQTIHFNEKLHDTITPAAAQKMFQFSGSRGDRVTLIVDSHTGPYGPELAHPQLELRNSAGDIIDRTASLIGTRMDTNLPATGNYTVVVSTKDSGASGGFDLALECAHCQFLQPNAPSTLYFPYLNHAAGELEGIAVSNPADAEAELQLSAYAEDGSLLYQTSISLKPHAQMSRLTSELFSKATSKRGWAMVTSKTAGLKGMFMLLDPRVTSMDGGEMSAAVSRSHVIADLAGANAGTLEITLLNPTLLKASASIDLTRPDGTLQVGRSFELGGLQLLSLKLDQIFAGTSIPAGSYLRCSSHPALVGFATVRQAGALAVSRVMDPYTLVPQLYSPQLAVGGGFYTRLSLVSSVSPPFFTTLTGTSAVTVSVFDENGRLHSKAANPKVTKLIPWSGKIELDVEPTFGFPAGKDVFAGWIKIETIPAGLINGTVTFGFKNANSITILPLSTEPMRNAVIPHTAQDASFFTGIALLNPGLGPATVNLKAYSSDGTNLATATVVLAPGKRLSKVVPEFWPTLAKLMGGHITLGADRDLIISSIFGTNTLTVLSAMPAMMIDK